MEVQWAGAWGHAKPTGTLLSDSHVSGTTMTQPVAAPEVGRVAILTPFAPSSRPGGVEVFTDQLAAALGGAEIFAPVPGGPSPSPGLAHLGLDQPARALEPARAFRKAHRANPFDVVISNGLCGWPLALSRDARVAIQVYHFTLAGLAAKALPRRSDRWTTGRVGGFFDRLAGAGKRVVAVSESVRREIASRYGHRAVVLPNGVDTGLFRRGDRTAAREQLGLPLDAPIGLFVGRAEYAKGFDLVQAAAQRMGDVLFLSVSDPAPGPPNLLFYRGVPHDRMPRLYSAADFFLLPSRYEGFNLSLLEALACELPVVTSAAAYPFGDGPPLASTVDPLTSDGLVQAARDALEAGPAPDLRERIVATYSLDAFMQRWVRFVRRLVAEGPRGIPSASGGAADDRI